MNAVTVEKTEILSLICPITQERMRNPVRIQGCWHIFEQSALKDWLEKNNTCPQCRKEVSWDQVKVDFTLKATIEEVKKNEEENSRELLEKDQTLALARAETNVLYQMVYPKQNQDRIPTREELNQHYLTLQTAFTHTVSSFSRGNQRDVMSFVQEIGTIVTCLRPSQILKCLTNACEQSVCSVDDIKDFFDRTSPLLPLGIQDKLDQVMINYEQNYKLEDVQTKYDEVCVKLNKSEAEREDQEKQHRIYIEQLKHQQKQIILEQEARGDLEDQIKRAESQYNKKMSEQNEKIKELEKNSQFLEKCLARAGGGTLTLGAFIAFAVYIRRKNN